MITLPEGAIIPMLLSPTDEGGWYIQTVVAMTRYRAIVPADAPRALARILVEAGVSDCPVIVFRQAARLGELGRHDEYPSLHAMAEGSSKDGGKA